MIKKNGEIISEKTIKNVVPYLFFLMISMAKIITIYRIPFVNIFYHIYLGCRKYFLAKIY